MDIHGSVLQLKGIGSKKAEALERLGILSVEDMIFFTPRSYEDRRYTACIEGLREGMTAGIEAEVISISISGYRRRGRQPMKLIVSDDTGMLEIVFFNAGYMKNAFKKQSRYFFYGKITRSGGKLQMIHPEFDSIEKAQRGILPVYPLTKGLSQKEMRQWQKSLQPEYIQIEEILPQHIIDARRLCSLSYALENIHFPQEKQKLLEAKYRLIFDELFVLQTGLLAARRSVKEGKSGIPLTADTGKYIASLSYELTGAQKRCVREIESDLESGRMMNRLVQGDVGSGKTALAEIAMYKAAASGYQSVLMAPTEILARQHFEHFCKAFEGHDIKVGFLSGNMKAAEKREALDKIRSGEYRIVVGTHAVIQPDVGFERLALVITDEQHRFGVRQRVMLKEKGANPHVLVMTATPIPRTLAVILYGDLDVSVIDELPPGRKAITTKTIGPDMRARCYDFLEKQIKQGRQAYVVAPLIEESDVLDVKSAQNIWEELTKKFKDFRVALIHGAMKQDEKDAVMADFYDGRTDILVATVVIEVGINVPNATVMVVENAERFGLAQLHQLRGRIGRGSEKSYCFLIFDGESEIAKKRGEIMASSADGFVIAEEDLKLRGPGDIFGTRQHGLPELNVSDIAKNLDILSEARDEAKTVIADDPTLESDENAGLKRSVLKLFGNEFIMEL